jgi:predicted methyltransferase
LNQPLKSLLLASSLAAATVFTSQAHAEDLSFSDKIKQAMASEQRSEADKERDRNRRPVKTLEFFGIKDNMTVLELIPGRGWYSRLLASALHDNGQLYLSIGADRMKDKISTEPTYSQVKVIAENIKLQYNPEKRLYDATEPDFKRKDIDAVLTFRNYHNFTYEGRTAINRAAFAALKPGGIYGVVDHSRRHMQDDDNENRRRVDPVMAIKEIEAAGFEFVDYSTLHYHPDDELRFEVGRKSVTGNTDRFTFLFKKPQ